jgi:transcriptional regulator with XRE-family HTH domain
MAKKRRGMQGDMDMPGGVRSAKLPPNLKRYREAAQLKQNELGRLLGHKDGAQVSAWEAGDKVPTLELTLETAAQLGVSTSQLVGELPPVLPGAHITNNVVNGEHHTVYQHVEGPLLMSNEFEAKLRKVVEEVVDARCAQLVEELRRVVQDVVQEHGAAPGPSEEDP